MASFVPNLPQNNSSDMSYLGLSRAISPFDIQPDRTGAIAVSDIGSLLKDAVTGVDNTVKDTINRSLYQSVDTQREGMTGALENIAGVPQANRVADTQPDASAAGQPLNILSGGDASNPPAAVENGISNISNLANASGNGKLSPSYYEGRLDLISKDLRARFPGWRDYIDEKISNITGGNPANKYMAELLSQINTGIQNNRTEMEKNLSYIRDNAGVPGAAVAATMVQSGKWGTAQVVQWGSQYKGIEAKAAYQKAGLDILQADQKTKEITAQSNINTLGDDLINHSLVTLNNSLGQGSSLPFNQSGALLSKIANGQISLTEPQGQQLVQSFSAFRQNMYMQLQDMAKKNGSSKILSPDQVNQNINAKLQPIDQIISNLSNKEYGAAYQSFNAVRTITDQSSADLMRSNNVTVQSYMTLAGALNKIGGPNASVKLLQSSIADGLPNALKTVVEQHKMGVATQIDPNNVQTLQQAVQDLQKAGVGVDPNNPNNPVKKVERGAYQDLTNLPNKLTDPNTSDSVKANIIKGSYGNANSNLVNMFDKDSVDSHGRLIPGNHDLFTRMTADAKTQEIWRLAKNDPSAWENYKIWAEKSHNILFSQDINDLNKIAMNPNLKLDYDNNFKGEHVPQFRLSSKIIPGAPGNAAVNLYADAFGFKIAEINSGLKSMALIAKREGKDPNAYLLNLMTSEGLDPNAPGLPSQLMRSVLSSGKQSFNDTNGELSLDSLKRVNYSNAGFEQAAGKLSQNGLNPQFEDGLRSAINDYSEETGNPVKLSSLVRTREQQAEAYARYQSGQGGLAAPPGHSRHEIGQAADINNDPKFLKWLKSRDVSQYGLEFLPGHAGEIDPGHIQLRRG